MVLSNKKYTDVLRVVAHFIEEGERRDACVSAIKDILKNELEQYNRGLAKLNENNRAKRERKRQEDLRKRVREYEEKKAADPALSGPPPSVVEL